MAGGYATQIALLNNTNATLVGRTLSQSASAQRLGDYPFTLGVASGDPAPANLSEEEMHAFNQLKVQFSKRRAYAQIMGTRP